jgi:hypothetical protein
MDTAERGYFLAVKDVAIFRGGSTSAAVRGATCLFRIEAKEELAAVGTLRSQLAIRAPVNGDTGPLTISSRQDYQANGTPRSHTRDKRCEPANVLERSLLGQ